MAEKQPEYYFYDRVKMHKAFFLSSFALLLSFVWMLYQDYAREWKEYQAEFVRLDIERTRREKQETESKLDQAMLADLKKKFEQADKEIAQHEKTLATLEKKAEEEEVALYKASQEYQFAKAEVDAAVYEYEESAASARAGRGTVGAADAALRHLQALRGVMDAKLAVLEPILVERRQIGESLKRLTGARDAAEKGIADLRAQVTNLEGKIARIQPSFVNTFRNAPFFDFIDPSIAIKQNVLPDYWDDYNFARVFKVDRCATCHLAIDTKGWDGRGVPKVYRSHPRLDLYLSSTSPHPVEKFGCTTCHDGQGRSLTFVDAAHTPADGKQAEEWKKRYGWHEPHHWDYPMKPMAHIESTCYKCHSQNEEIRGADHWNRGRKLFERAGCFGCHQTDNFLHLRKIGPDLYHLAEKVTEDWVYQWVLDPPAIRPTTRMPKIFNLSNTREGEDPQRNVVAADAITTYLFSRAESLPLVEPPAAGDARKGKDLFDRVGCKACHVLGDRNDPGDGYSSFGPNLTGVGSKTTRRWLYNWIKDPKAIFPETLMPNLRLTDEEAVDLSEFLAAQKDPVALPRTPRPTAALSGYLDGLALDFLKSKLTAREADAELAAMKKREAEGRTQERKLYVGERFINRQGCFGCHNIRGMERLTPIGVTFTGGGAIGSKDIDRIDFGFTAIPRTRYDWFALKVKEPRIFDQGRDRIYQDKLRMPYFTWLAEAKTKDGAPDDSVIQDLTTFTLGFVKTEVPLAYRKTPNEREAALEAGRRIVLRSNCRACHQVDGKGGDTIRTAVAAWLTEEQFGRPEAEVGESDRKMMTKRAFALAPPPLDIVGERLQPAWVFGFLKRPFRLRPHLAVRMPTFGFSDDEANALVKFFAFQSDQKFPYESPADTGCLARWQDPLTGKVNELKDKDYLREAKAIFIQFECAKCHQDPVPGQDLANLAPNFLISSQRLKADWVLKWVHDPGSIIPGTRMPKFWPDNTIEDKFGGDAELQMKAVRDWTLQIKSKDDLVELAEEKAARERQEKQQAEEQERREREEKERQVEGRKEKGK